jgi:hypothetical protein
MALVGLRREGENLQHRSAMAVAVYIHLQFRAGLNWLASEANGGNKASGYEQTQPPPVPSSSWGERRRGGREAASGEEEEEPWEEMWVYA